MATPRRRLTLSVERELTGPSGMPERVRLTADLEPAAGSSDEPTLEELRKALERLRGELDGLVGPASAPSEVPRPLEELVETYRPRQAELIDLLRADGEISEAEASLLRGALAAAPAPPSVPPKLRTEVPPPSDRPLAALPLENDRTPSSPRPVAQLLDLYRIETLKQAGAVRARRQISYEEYMALKRHFAALEAAAAAEVRVAAASSDPPPSTSG